LKNVEAGNLVSLAFLPLPDIKMGNMFKGKVSEINSVGGEGSVAGWRQKGGGMGKSKNIKLRGGKK